MTRVLHCAYPIAYDSILHAELGPHRSVDQQPVDACGCDFHRDWAVDGHRISLHLRSKGDWPGQGPIEGALLAVRLFQDQLPVVMRAYGRILRGTGSYLRLAFTPFLIAILPITFLIVQLDRYFGWMPLRPAQTFLIEARVNDPAAANEVELQLPPELVSSAPQSIFLRITKWCGVSPRSARDNTIFRSPPLARRFRSRCGLAGLARDFAGAFARKVLGAHVHFRRARAGGK